MRHFSKSKVPTKTPAKKMNTSSDETVFLTKSYINHMVEILMDLQETIECSLVRSEQVLEQAMVGYETMFGKGSDNPLSEFVEPSRLKQRLNILVLERLQALQQIHSSVFEPLIALTHQSEKHSEGQPQNITTNVSQCQSDQVETIALKKILSHLQQKLKLENDETKIRLIKEDIQKVDKEIYCIEMCAFASPIIKATPSDCDSTPQGQPSRRQKQRRVVPPLGSSVEKILFDSEKDHSGYWSNSSSITRDDIEEGHTDLNSQLFESMIFGKEEIPLDETIHEQSSILSKRGDVVVDDSDSDIDDHLFLTSQFLTRYKNQNGINEPVMDRLVNEIKKQHTLIPQQLAKTNSKPVPVKSTTSPKTTVKPVTATTFMDEKKKTPKGFRLDMNKPKETTKLPNHVGLARSLRMAIPKTK